MLTIKLESGDAYRITPLAGLVMISAIEQEYQPGFAASCLDLTPNEAEQLIDHLHEAIDTAKADALELDL